MRLACVVGARPQFIKAAPVSRAMKRLGVDELLVHTGQHYDTEMSELFFQQLGLPEPTVNLGVGSGTPGWQVGQMLIRLENFLREHPVNSVLVYGDTNTTLAGALAANKLGIRLAHVEAGLRSFNRTMPEEHNRVLTDHVSDLLFCPTSNAVANLKRENILDDVHLVGDTMYDALLQFLSMAESSSRILERLALESGSYLLATIHRQSNTDVPENLVRLLEILSAAGETVVFPVHPRTRKKIDHLQTEGKLPSSKNVRFLDPVGYLDMLTLERHARTVLTDSGGVQKEAFLLAVPCVTLRTETEWVETLEGGWNAVAGLEPQCVLEALRRPRPSEKPPPVFGDGKASEKIVEVLMINQESPTAAPTGLRQ